jgi:hypothetical protein
MGSRHVSGALGLVLAACLLAMPSASAAVPNAAPAGSIGYDLSYPQCPDSNLPVGGAFGVVGINGGRAFDTNACLQREYDWAAGMPYTAQAYLNTGNPGPVSSHWPVAGTAGGVTCVDATVSTDPGCAYGYGWSAAADAMVKAATAGIPAGAHTWWLDVERANSWNKPQDGQNGLVANAADLQGFYDCLRSHGVDEVGFYSSGLQWKEITGGYSASTAGFYKLGWAPHFAPVYPMETAPLWIAGVDAGTAPSNCATTFTGAPAMLAQYIDSAGRDADLVCGTPPPPPPPPPSPPPAPRKPAAPGSLTAHTAHGKGAALSWNAPAADPAAPATSYTVYRSTKRGAEKSYAAVRCAATKCAWTDTHAKHQTRYYYRVRALNNVGSGPLSNEASAKGH